MIHTILYKQIRIFAFILLVITVGYDSAKAQEFTIDTDYPGGNVIVSNTEITSTKYYHLNSDTLYVRPDLRDTPRFWFYWNFRISEAGNRKVVFKFPGSYIGAFGPAFSTDGGESWLWLYDNISDNATTFEYTLHEGQDVLFSQGIPYLESNFTKFINQFLDNPNLKIESLATSKKGRDVKKVLIQHPTKKPKYKVMLTARHHACEAMVNYVLEGIILAVLEGEENTDKWLRENVAFFIVPFVDKDGVEDGDQGKNRMPYDHNMDYGRKSIYNSTAAIRTQVSVWADGELTAALDLHCPGLRGKWAETIFAVGSSDENIAKEQGGFIEILKSNSEGELRFHPERSFIEFGTGWNNATEKTDLFGCREWASLQKGNKLAATLEIAYANNNGQMVTPRNAKMLGADIARALAVYLNKDK